MKKSTIKKMSEEELMMAKAVCDFHPFARNSVLIDKGDMKAPYWNRLLNWEDNFSDLEDDEDVATPMKNMKAADRRKRTYHKHQQRERQYRNLGYHLDRFSKADLGKMKEGVGMFPETQHQYTLYNRGEKKGEKPITTKQAISMMEHERWLDEQEQLAAEEEYEYIMTSIYVDEMKESVCWLNNQLEYSNARLRQMMESIKELNDSINSMRQEKERLIERIMKEEDWLEAHKK